MKKKEICRIGMPQKVTFVPVKEGATLEEIKAEMIKYLMANWIRLRDGEVIIENKKGAACKR